MCDFPLLCERFTTSKLESYTDLQSIATFGFRGEALASMTHVARVAITSMTRCAPCAYRGDFRDGRMIDPSRGDELVAAAKPCAGVQGTTVLVEDLFFNVPIRRAALRNSHNEEYVKCLDVLSKYALHYAGRVSISCKKHGANKADLNTPLQATHVDHVRTIYGSSLSKELLPVSLNLDSAGCRSRGIESAHFRVSGLVTNANFNQKKMQFILFINDRLVESTNLRRLVDTVYAQYLPRGAHPFVYLALAMDARILDVNVHPTKKEVHFLYEDQMTAAIEEALETALKGANKSRVFYAQSILASGTTPTRTTADTGHAAAAANKTHLSGGPPNPLPMMSSVRGLGGRREDVADATMINLDDPRPAAAAITSHHNTDSGDIRDTTTVVRMDDSPAPPSVGTPLRLSQSIAQSRLTSGTSHFTALRAPSAPTATPPRRDNHLVRTDNRQGRLDAFLTQPSHSSPRAKTEADQSQKRTHADIGEVIDEDDDPLVTQPPSASVSAPISTTATAPAAPAGLRRPRPPVQLLTSVQNLLAAITTGSHASLADLCRQHTFVGFVDHAFSLVQHHTKLYLINTERLSAAFFYETVLRYFGHMHIMRFAKPVPVQPMIRMAMERDAGDKPPLALDAHARDLTELLSTRAAMLQEYFALEMSVVDGELLLLGIPELLDQYNPPLVLLPLFLLRLSRDCDWTAEQACFESVARCIADFYRFQPEKMYLADPRNSSRSHAAATPSQPVVAPLPSLAWVVTHLFFPALRHRSSFTPPMRAATDGTITQVASLENLYKIFERC